MVRTLERIDIPALIQRIEDMEKRLDVLEDIIESLIPEDDEEIELEEPSGVKEYQKGDFLRWGRERGLIG